MRDVREYVLCSGCRRRKRSSSQQVALFPARNIKQSEVLKVDLLRISATSSAGNEYILLAVDKERVSVSEWRARSGTGSVLFALDLAPVASDTPVPTK